MKWARPKFFFFACLATLFLSVCTAGHSFGAPVSCAELLELVSQAAPKCPSLSCGLDAKALKKFVDAHPRALRPVVSKLLTHVHHITHQELEVALVETMLRFASENPVLMHGAPFVIYVPHEEKNFNELINGSNQWMVRLLAVLKSRGKTFPANFVVVDNPRDLKSFLEKNANCKDIAFIDEASFTGSQAAGIKEEALADLHIANLRLHFLFPYMTEISKSVIQEDGLSGDPIKHHSTFTHCFYDVRGLQTVEEILSTSQFSPDERELVRRVYRIKPGTSLSYFDHSIPDTMLAAPDEMNPDAGHERGSTQFVMGKVVDLRGQVIGTVPILTARPARIYESSLPLSQRRSPR